MVKALNIVVPLAGRGARFSAAGYSVPKPLIPVAGQPMYAHALNSLPLAAASRLILVCLAQHAEAGGLRADALSRFGHLNPLIISLNEVTAGQACTVLAAREHIDNGDGLLIHNGDTAFRSNLAALLKDPAAAADGIITVFRTSGPQWSYARLDAGGAITEVAEKKEISEWGTVGAYYFARGADFVHAVDDAIVQNDAVRGEFYVGPLYNRLIKNGKRIIPDYASEIRCMGTPEDLARLS